MIATTITEGDPTWAGPLAGSGLSIPVYHILDPEIKAEISAELYEEEIGLFELATEESEEILSSLEKIRARIPGRA
tara:strand:- start:1280 stop:1507 length:228 start_codon:yes stop_codon:yes gene_type:complete